MNDELTRLSVVIDDQLSQFAARSRDPEGRYVQGGSVAGVDDFRAAHMPRKRKLRRSVIGAAAGVAGGAAGLYAMGKGDKRSARFGYGVSRAVRKIAGS